MGMNNNMICQNKGLIEGEEAVQMISALASSMENTQRIAIDVEGAGEQVLAMSGKNEIAKTIDYILMAPDLSMNEKMNLIQKMNSIYGANLDRSSSIVMKMQRNQALTSFMTGTVCALKWTAILVIMSLPFLLPYLIKQEEEENDSDKTTGVIPEKVTQNLYNDSSAAVIQPC